MSSTCNTCNAFPECHFWPMESLHFAASDSQEQQLLKSGWTRSWIVMEFSWEPTWAEHAKAWMPRCCTWIEKTLPAEKWLIYSETSGGMMTEVAWEYYRNYVVRTLICILKLPLTCVLWQARFNSVGPWQWHCGWHCHALQALAKKSKKDAMDHNNTTSISNM